MFPNITLNFSINNKISIFPIHYLIPVDPNKSSNDSQIFKVGAYPGRLILGMSFIRGLDIYFD